MNRIFKLNPMQESSIQHAIFLWSEQPSIRSQFPELALLHHIKNETAYSDAKQIAIDKASGVKKGVPDLSLPCPHGGFHGLYIELKTPKGKPSKEQLWWIDKLSEHGYCACICYGYQEAIKCVAKYLSLPNPNTVRTNKQKS